MFHILFTSPNTLHSHPTRSLSISSPRFHSSVSPSWSSHLPTSQRHPPSLLPLFPPLFFSFSLSLLSRVSLILFTYFQTRTRNPPHTFISTVYPPVPYSPTPTPEKPQHPEKKKMSLQQIHPQKQPLPTLEQPLRKATWMASQFNLTKSTIGAGLLVSLTSPLPSHCSHTELKEIHSSYRTHS